MVAMKLWPPFCNKTIGMHLWFAGLLPYVWPPCKCNECPEPCPWDHPARSALQKVRSWRSPGSDPEPGTPFKNLGAMWLWAVLVDKLCSWKKSARLSRQQLHGWGKYHSRILGYKLLLACGNINLEAICDLEALFFGKVTKLHDEDIFQQVISFFAKLRTPMVQSGSLYYCIWLYIVIVFSIFQLGSLQTIRYRPPSQLLHLLVLTHDLDVCTIDAHTHALHSCTLRGWHCFITGRKRSTHHCAQRHAWWYRIWQLKIILTFDDL